MLTSLALGLALICSTATAQSFDDLSSYNYAGEARQMNLNDTESQLIVGSSILFVILIPLLMYFLLTVPEASSSRRRAGLKNVGHSNRYNRFEHINIMHRISVSTNIHSFAPCS